MSERGRMYLIVGIIVIVGILLSAVAGAVAGGIAGHFTARREQSSIVTNGVPESQEPQQLPIVPRRQLTPQATPPFVQRPFENARPGALLIEVVPDSPAAKAGLQADDIITAVNDDDLSFSMTLTQVIANYAPGQTVTITYLRNGQTETTQLTLGGNPDNPQQPYMGVTYRTFVPPQN
jgi:membrane-associated protease RseP (regulator of RpoE activity)